MGATVMSQLLAQLLRERSSRHVSALTAGDLSITGKRPQGRVRITGKQTPSLNSFYCHKGPQSSPSLKQRSYRLDRMCRGGSLTRLLIGVKSFLASLVRRHTKTSALGGDAAKLLQSFSDVEVDIVGRAAVQSKLHIVPLRTINMQVRRMMRLAVTIHIHFAAPPGLMYHMQRDRRSRYRVVDVPKTRLLASETLNLAKALTKGSIHYETADEWLGRAVKQEVSRVKAKRETPDDCDP